MLKQKHMWVRWSVVHILIVLVYIKDEDTSTQLKSDSNSIFVQLMYSKYRNFFFSTLSVVIVSVAAITVKCLVA